MIEIILLDEQDPMLFKVQVGEPDKINKFKVTISHELFNRLQGENDYSPQLVIDSVFRFLLDREPVDSILSSFDVSIVSMYFPEFEHAIQNYLDPNHVQ